MKVKNIVKRMEWGYVRIWDKSDTIPAYEGDSHNIPKKYLKRKIRKEDGLYPCGPVKEICDNEPFLRISLEEK